MNSLQIINIRLLILYAAVGCRSRWGDIWPNGKVYLFTDVKAYDDDKKTMTANIEVYKSRKFVNELASRMTPHERNVNINKSEKHAMKSTVMNFRDDIYWEVVSQFTACHDDPVYEPDAGDPIPPGAFTWLGALQYIHVKNGTPHYFRVPRVLLITRQFVLSTARDAAVIPEDYALGNVIFGDYERDEEECGLKMEEIAAGAECLAAIVLMPIADVLLHPEYKHFGAQDSIAIMKLLKAVKSNYMVPVCIPFKDYLIVGKDGSVTAEKIYHLDFVNEVPRDFVDEEKEITKLSLLPRELCYLYDDPENSTHLVKNRIICTTGCGFHSGAPSIVHEHTGHWTVVALAEGGSTCPDPLRPRRPPSPPRHIVLYPYVPWITAAIAGRPIGGFAKDDPFGYTMPRAESTQEFRPQWSGHWWMGGVRCYDRGDFADDMFKFYKEIFQVTPEKSTWILYNLDLEASPETSIICVKVGMPYRSVVPRVSRMNKPNVRIEVAAMHLYHSYMFEVEAWAYNQTEDAENDYSVSGCNENEYCSKGG